MMFVLNGKAAAAGFIVFCFFVKIFSGINFLIKFKS